MQEGTKKFYRFALIVCPPLALIFSILVTMTTLYINEGISPVFIFISIQVYLNWYSICTISQSAITMKSSPAREQTTNKNSHNCTVAITINSGPRLRYWYCQRCDCHTYKPTQHCGACKKCFHFRDHHCFFIGGCILKQNMGNFILICLHTSLACLHSLIVIGPYLYVNLQEINEKNSSLGNILLNFCFPIAMAKLIITRDTSYLLLITLFDILFSVCVVSFLYGSWKLFCCLTGRQRYYPNVGRKQNLIEIFGNYGLWNFFFPYNGLVGSGDCNSKKYVLKEI